jgi:hypothetical protein
VTLPAHLALPVRGPLPIARSIAWHAVGPASTVVVDHGSTDETAAVLADYARRLPYLRLVRRTDRGRWGPAPVVFGSWKLARPTL